MDAEKVKDGWNEPRKLTGTPIRFENGYSWEMDEAGNHCIVGADGVRSDWVAYTSIALSRDSRFFVVTAYFGATGEWAKRPECGLKAGTLYQIAEIKEAMNGNEE